ncbi:hypothetical protein HPP92_005263 [Vanilla planifolia]|uniref:Uncharacterized protein n=1 Tax=Vanilla planifolia TaxID=51239 RepID=A0A835RPS6_VANPL|nr:hypothetical protein HPP92_005548 [Vanilla planifolia]KAG0494269.1 hypothetical protein HPP92_005263 [Vanilla planifolia]
MASTDAAIPAFYFSEASSFQRKEKRAPSDSLGRRCLTMAKHQKTRFYIFRRCVFMLLCWHAHAVSD